MEVRRRERGEAEAGTRESEKSGRKPEKEGERRDCLAIGHHLLAVGKGGTGGEGGEDAAIPIGGTLDEETPP